MGWNVVITKLFGRRAQGKSSNEVAQITGYSRSWIYELVWGYNRLGADTLGDKRHDNPGAKPLLDGYATSTTMATVTAAASRWGSLGWAKGGCLDEPDFRATNSSLTGMGIPEGIGDAPPRQCPEHEESDPIEQQQWKKNGADCKTSVLLIS